MSLQLGIGFILAVVIAGVAWKAHSLSASGALAAVVLGTIIFGLGGLPWAVLLVGFFISSSLFSKMFIKRKASLGEKFSKGSQRDAWQVLANGGVAGFLVLLNLFLPDQRWIWLAFAASLAGSNADTWATELGTLSPVLPRLITTMRKVEKGTSGGVSLVGTLSATAGALLIALLAVLPWKDVSAQSSILISIFRLVLITATGVFGSLVDSVLGATIQSIYTCPTCNKETERHPYHTCGTPTVLERGWGWLNNDWVNISCGLGAAILAAVLGNLLPNWFGI